MAQGILVPKWATAVLGFVFSLGLVGIFWTGATSAALSKDIAHLSNAVAELKLALVATRTETKSEIASSRAECVDKHVASMTTLQLLRERVVKLESVKQ